MSLGEIDPIEIVMEFLFDRLCLGECRLRFFNVLSYPTASSDKLVSGRRLENSDVSIHFRFGNFKRDFREVSISFFQTAMLDYLPEAYAKYKKENPDWKTKPMTNRYFIDYLEQVVPLSARP